MPTISQFFGIVIQMFWREHAPPHFHALYGEGPQAMAARLRLNHAAHLLQGTSLSVGEVGAVCGFENNCSFSRAFRERYGLPPSTYRLNARAFTTDHANPRGRERKAVLAFGT